MHLSKLRLIAVVILHGAISANAACLDEATKFAERICGELKTRGNSSLVEANGELKAEVTGIIRKVVGSGGASINGKALTEAYENVMRSDLAKDLSDNRSCRREMVKVGIAQACKSEKDTTQKTSHCNFFAQDDICLGMTRVAFKQLPLGAISKWESDGSHLVAMFDHRSRGLQGKVWLYFLNDKLTEAKFETTVSAWSSNLNRNVFAGSSLKPKWQNEQERSGGDTMRVLNFCQSFNEIRREYNDRYGPPSKLHPKESTSIHGLMQKSDDYCKGDTCEIDDSSKVVERATYPYGSGATAEVATTLIRASWNRYMGSNYRLDIRTRDACTLTLHFAYA